MKVMKKIYGLWKLTEIFKLCNCYLNNKYHHQVY